MESATVKLTKLKGIENWATWKFQIRLTLKSCQAWGIVDGTLAKPAATEATELKTWTVKDDQAQQIIGTTVEDKPLLHIINCDSAKAMWDKLVSVYEQKSETSVHMLLQDWYRYEMSASDDIATHVSRLEDLAHRLEVMGQKIPDQMIVTKILMTLPSSFKHFVSAWESTPADDRTLSNLIARLITEETRLNPRDSQENRALVASGHKSRNDRNICNYCKQSGHWKNECEAKKAADAKKNAYMRGNAL